MRGLVCPNRGVDCSDCSEKHRCPYSYLFETFRPEGSERLRGQTMVPHPLVLTSPLPRGRAFKKGEELRFGIDLFGNAAEHLAQLVVAVEKMAHDGLQRVPFELTAVRDRPLMRPSSTIFDGRIPFSPAAAETLSDVGIGDEGHEGASLQLLSPTRLVYRGRLTRRPSFEVLVRSLLMRSLAMLNFHCGVDVDFDIATLVSAAAAVETVESNLWLVRLSRSSERQKNRIPLDGMLGNIGFEGPAVKEMWTLLRAGELLRVGKGTIFGLGHYSLSSE